MQEKAVSCLQVHYYPHVVHIFGVQDPHSSLIGMPRINSHTISAVELLPFPSEEATVTRANPLLLERTQVLFFVASEAIQVAID